VIAALDRVRPGLAEPVAGLLGAPAPQSFEAPVTALINQLVAQPGLDGVPLVLDDYHLIDAQPVHASLEFLLEHLPPGLQLAGLSLREQTDVAGFVASFSGSHRYVLDYLADEVLERQPDEVRAFLLATSVLERLSGSCVTRSPAAATARRCLRASSGPTCSWCRWMRCAAGGATTSCSPTCSAPACDSNGPARYQSCIGPRPPGVRSTGSLATPSTTR
jgi:hypothetical protein